jgi:hypothetical protein
MKLGREKRGRTILVPIRISKQNGFARPILALNLPP